MVRTTEFFDTIAEISELKTGGECALRTLELLGSVRPGDVVKNDDGLRNKALLESLGLVESDGLITQDALDFWRSHHRVEGENLIIVDGGVIHSIIPLKASPQEAVCFTEVYDDEQMLVCYAPVPVRI